MFPRGSVGGVYLRPVDIPIEYLRSPRCIHPVSVAPTGVNSNVVISEALKDIINGSYEGFETVDAEGAPCKIFLHLIGYVGDYPESSAVIDVMKHSARAPCTLCNFRFTKTDFGKSYCSSSSSHSLNSSFTRGWFRTKAIRYSGIKPNEATWLGINEGDLNSMLSDKDDEWVLLKIANDFDANNEAGRKAPLTSDGIQVVPCRFDPYLQNIVAPDHCITGIIKSLLKVCFDELSKKQGKILDHTLVTTISKMGITGQSSLYNSKTKTLNGVSMSTLFALLSILPSVLLACGFDKKVKSFSVIRSYANLISHLFWWPTHREDDSSSIKHVHDSEDYYIDMKAHLFTFIDDLQKFYTVDGTNASTIDTPNVHRIMELVLVTTPIFGHCLLIAELPFEAFHQPLKKNLSKNTSSKSHLTAMKCVVFADWFRRVSSEMAKVGGSDDDDGKLNELLKLLVPLGHYLFSSGLSDDELVDFRQSIVLHVKQELLGPLSDFLGDHYNSNLYNAQDEFDYYWTSSNPLAAKAMIPIEVPGDIQELERASICTVLGLGTSQSDDSRDTLSRVNMIHLLRRVEEGDKGANSKRHHRLSIGDIIQVACRMGTSLDFVVDTVTHSQKHTIQHKLEYYMILGLYETSSNNFWSVVTKLNLVRDNHYKLKITRTSIQLLRMSTMVRKCGVLHYCAMGKDCVMGHKKRKTRHKLNYTNSLNVLVLSSRYGFPFRSA